ncbi:hypothetical protein ABH14_09070 [Brevibacillus brevis]|uniref:hypothetical protein n=1 Tax=Brevibacillus brevis TaxID=1393 RepID=UPI0019014D30|nr:hypothetical protein [Brevibacillus brevis]MBH0329954.1 hypothetical protein [Brevibacillus brevis]
MKTIQYFCTGGETETGGILDFLNKINSNVRWVRAFPALKKGAKPKRSTDPSYRPMARTHTGVTGSSLVYEMKQILQLYPHQFKTTHCDGILLIDDADCRFLVQGSIDTWYSQVSNDINSILGEEIPFYVLIASPEIEAWFIADWQNSFGLEYDFAPGFEHQLKQHLKTRILGSTDWENIELFGGPVKNGACTIKLSNEIINTFSDQTFLQPFVKSYGEELVRYKLKYSKKTHGAAMLRRIDPQSVNKKCNSFFSSFYRMLTDL